MGTIAIVGFIVDGMAKQLCPHMRRFVLTVKPKNSKELVARSVNRD